MEDLEDRMKKVKYRKYNCHCTVRIYDMQLVFLKFGFVRLELDCDITPKLSLFLSLRTEIWDFASDGQLINRRQYRAISQAISSAMFRVNLGFCSKN